jgi:hypothetical protein
MSSAADCALSFEPGTTLAGPLDADGRAELVPTKAKAAPPTTITSAIRTMTRAGLSDGLGRPDAPDGLVVVDTSARDYLLCHPRYLPLGTLTVEVAWA